MKFYLLSVAFLFAACLTCAASPSSESRDDGIVTTHHQISVANKILRYTAKAGLIPIRDNEAGDIHGNMFFVAYTLDRPTGSAPRPLTFLWNGGPGSNSGMVHLLGFGPRRVMVATGSMPRLSPSGTALADNQDTWLVYSDLVFIDPIGTGYSRPAKPEYAGEFYQSRGDAESVAEFIRVYRTRFDTFDQPLYIMGESYGVTRCALVSEALERRRTKVTGVIMLSGGFPIAATDPALRNALNLPTLTAAAYYNKKLPPDLQGGDLKHAVQASENYSEGEYARVLTGHGDLTDAQRDSVIEQLSRFTGLPASMIDRSKLVVGLEQFSNGLLAGQNLMVGHYDSRMIGPRDPKPPYDPTTDPSLKDILDGISVIRYLRNELGFKSDLFYQGPFGGGYPPATSFRGDWMSMRWNRSVTPAGGTGAGRGTATGNGIPSPVEAFHSAMTTDKNLRVLVVTGYYDLVSSYFAIEQEARRLPPELADRVTIRTYAGGHAIYTDDTARRQFAVDAGKFYQAGNSK